MSAPSATKRTSLMPMAGSPPWASAARNCPARSLGLVPAAAKAPTNRWNSSCVTPEPNWRLLTPEEESRLAKPRSTGVSPMGAPSSSNSDPEAPRTTGASGSSACNCSQVVVNCWATCSCATPYNRTDFSRLLRPRTNSRACSTFASLPIPSRRRFYTRRMGLGEGRNGGGLRKAGNGAPYRGDDVLHRHGPPQEL